MLSEKTYLARVLDRLKVRVSKQCKINFDYALLPSKSGAIGGKTIYPYRDSALVVLYVPEFDDIDEVESFYHVVEVSVAMLHECRHVFQYERLYLKQNHDTQRIMTFDLVGKYIPELDIDHDAIFYCRLPSELDAELHAFILTRKFLPSVLDIPQELVDTALLDYANECSEDSKVYFFSRPYNDEYKSFSDFVKRAKDRLLKSPYFPIQLPQYINDDSSKYLRFLNDYDDGLLYDCLRNSLDAPLVAATLADVVLMFEPDLRLNFFGSDKVRLTDSLFNDVLPEPTLRRRCLDKILNFSIVNSNHDERDLSL